MANHIPDEIISEILSPALRVSDATFCAMSESGASPFMKFSESSSAYLVVSKAWLRVATPLLYNVVAIRSKAQAQALAATLTTNPALGRFIKKLRVEGGYAISMLKILQTSPNITDLFLSLAIASPDNACGLCRGLPLANPVRVIIDTAIGWRYWSGISKHAKPLVEALVKSIPTWENLAVFEIPDGLGCRGRSEIPEALRQAPKLDTLLVWDHDRSLQRVPEYIRIIAANPSLKRIRIEPHLSPQEHQFLLSHRKKFCDEVKQDAKLKTLLDLADESAIPVDVPPPFMYPPRLAADSVQEDTIWSRVLYFALYRDNTSWGMRLAPLLVCKTFARVGVPHLYESPELYLIWTLEAFASQLARQPPLGRHVQCLSICHFSDSAVLKIIAQTPSLTKLFGMRNCMPLKWQAFNDLAKLAGSMLRTFQRIPIYKASGATSPAVFALFSQMRVFGWDSKTTFKTEPKLIPANTFSLLVDLTVKTYDESFLDVLSHMELPSLQTVVFPATARGGAQFFKVHGAKLQKLTLSESQIKDPKLAIWRNCPSLTVLGVACDEKNPASAACLQTSDTHTCLERIVFRLPHQYYRLKQWQEAELGKFMSTLRSTTSFPTLREVEHPLCHWPTTEPAISKSRWARWAESLLERDVHLIGTDRVSWRPRLKYVPKNKQ
ncbi:hypothetical protein B0H19DRAFT_1200262 [Mycena capillaripes]|nr:hypothetical protein B0H19DRAFT_1200262 [Mycena capillaripes]